jgi:SAM-dependent methyltransferase
MQATDSIADWLESPLGASVLDIEGRVLQEALSDVVGFELLQVGRWGDTGRLCAAARTQHRRWLAPDAEGPRAIRAACDALPVASNTVEAVLLPHTLEFADAPHEVLREVERVLVGEGIVLICAFNPLGPWGLRHLLSRRRFPPGLSRYLFAPPWTKRLPGRGRSWLESRGPGLAPPLAGAYLLKARKRVRAVTPLKPVWQTRSARVGGIAEPTSRLAA